MKERGILFSGPMVRAILEGRKQQTRRVMKVQPTLHDFGEAGGGMRYAIVPPQTTPGYLAVGCHVIKAGDTAYAKMPYGVPGDRLWVKEAWAYRLDCDHLNGTQLYERGVRQAWYWADGPGRCCNTGCAGAAGRVRSSRFMPRWASRITLEITDVRVQRLQEISEEDARAEGVSATKYSEQDVADIQISDVDPAIKELAKILGPGTFTAKGEYMMLWDSINAKSHPWASNPWVWALTFRRIDA